MRSWAVVLAEELRQTREVVAARVLVERFGPEAVRAWTLRSHAAYAPLHRLRYRWSLRRQAPAWKAARARRHRRLQRVFAQDFPTTWGTKNAWANIWGNAGLSAAERQEYDRSFTDTGA